MGVKWEKPPQANGPPGFGYVALSSRTRGKEQTLMREEIKIREKKELNGGPELIKVDKLGRKDEGE